eukprot:427114-Amphidinium_carterae.1
MLRQTYLLGKKSCGTPTPQEALCTNTMSSGMSGESWSLLYRLSGGSPQGPTNIGAENCPRN